MDERHSIHMSVLTNEGDAHAWATCYVPVSAGRGVAAMVNLPRPISFRWITDG